MRSAEQHSGDQALARASVVIVLALLSAPACAQSTPPISADDDDAAALALPFNTASVSTARSTALALEAEQTDSTLPQGGAIDAQRLSMDLRSNLQLGAHWRLQWADRLDLIWPGMFAGVQPINTFKEAYVSWQPQPNVLLDLGRINVRQGVAYGYNPTDFLRADAIRTVDSIDPDSLRQNRLGTVMLRAQQLWDSGSLTELFAPQLAQHATAAPLDPDLGATNGDTRWMLSLSQRLLGSFSPQWLIEGTQGSPAQLGINTTVPLGQATIAYLELATGESRSLWQQALALSAPDAVHTRLAAGVTYSAPNKTSFTLEYEYDSAALSARAWAAAGTGASTGALQNYGRYREFVSLQQELPTQHSALLVTSWQDALLRHLDFSAFLRVDLVDHSRLPWTELRYHWTHLDAAMRWQDYLGSERSDLGASPTRQSWQLLLDYYL